MYGGANAIKKMMTKEERNAYMRARYLENLDKMRKYNREYQREYHGAVERRVDKWKDEMRREIIELVETQKTWTSSSLIKKINELE